MPKGERFLIIRLSSIGDVLHATPVARELKKAVPSCHITWLVGENPASLLACNPYIDTVHVWPREEWEKALRAGRLGEAWSLWRALKQDLAERAFDVALDVHGLFLTGMIAKMTGAPRRIGLARTREVNRLFMTETAPFPPESRHVIYRYLSVLRPLGIEARDSRMDLFLSPQDQDFASGFLKRRRLQPEKPLVALCPATTWPDKNWPSEYFAAVIDGLQDQAELLLCGGPGERLLAERIIRQVQAPVINGVGRVSLTEMAALLARSAVLLSGDTGPLHMAVALETPTVSVYGPTDPAVYGPLAGPHRILTGGAACAPCNKRRCSKGSSQCMYSVTPELAIRAIKEFL